MSTSATTAADAKAAQETITALMRAATDDELLAIRSAALKAGLLWACRCKWYNPAAAVTCEDCAEPRLARYREGEVIEYMSFANSGYTVGQVMRYAPAAEQDSPADPRVYIRTRSGSKPFPVRESQIRPKADTPQRT